MGGDELLRRGTRAHGRKERHPRAPTQPIIDQMQNEGKRTVRPESIWCDRKKEKQKEDRCTYILLLRLLNEKGFSIVSQLHVQVDGLSVHLNVNLEESQHIKEATSSLGKHDLLLDDCMDEVIDWCAEEESVSARWVMRKIEGALFGQWQVAKSAKT